MSDIVERLLARPMYEGSGEESNLPEDAAAEITVLRAQVEAATARGEKMEAQAWRDAMERAAKIADGQGHFKLADRLRVLTTDTEERP